MAYLSGVSYYEVRLNPRMVFIHITESRPRVNAETKVFS